MANQRHDRTAVLVHAGAWCLFGLLYGLYASKVASDAFGGMADFLFFLICQIALFYINALWVLPKAFAHKKKTVFRLLLYLFLEIVVFLFLILGLSILTGALKLSLDRSMPWLVVIVNFFHLVLPMCFGLILSAAYYGLLWGLEQYRANRRATNAIAGLENEVELIKQDWLKAQLNPHLLYNILPVVRYTAVHEPEKARKATTTLIEMMRYYIQRSPDGFIPLEEEIQQTQNLIALYKIRLGKGCKVELTVHGAISGLKVLPMSVLLLTDNLFKHGEVLDEKHPATISIEVLNAQLRIKTDNHIAPPKEVGKSGNGLQNLRDRLAHFYPDSHVFRYGATGKRFQVELTIDLVDDN